MSDPEAMLHRLRAELRDHITATEGPDGLYDEIRRSDPRLSGAVVRLHKEHGRLAAALEELAAGFTPGKLREVLKRLGRHCNRGQQLAYETVALDLGGQD